MGKTCFFLGGGGGGRQDADVLLFFHQLLWLHQLLRLHQTASSELAVNCARLCAPL